MKAILPVILIFLQIPTSITALRIGDHTSRNVSPNPATLAAFAEQPSISFLSVDELKELLRKKQQVFIIDARGADYDAGSTKIKGAVHIPPDEIEQRTKEIPRNKLVVAYCACPDDGGAISAAQTLMGLGYTRLKVLKGGWDAWNAAHGTVEPK